MAHQSDIGGQLDDAGSTTHGLHPVVHEICHDDQMDDLWGHEPVPYVFGEEAHGSIRVQLCVSKDPENDKEDTGDPLGRHEVWGEGFDVAFLSRWRVTLLRNSTNWDMIAKLSRYWVNAHRKSPTTERFRLEWKRVAKTMATKMSQYDLTVSSYRS